MTTHELLQALGTKLGFVPEISEEGVCTLLFDQDAVDFEEADGALLLIAELCPLPQDGQEALLRKLLAANCYGAETGGATLSLDSDADLVLFHRSLPLPLDYAPFEDALSRFVQHLRHWKQELNGTTPAADSAAAQPQSPMMRV